MTGTGRTEMFSDGVLAIAVTLLMLDLRVPVAHDLHRPLVRALAAQWPAYAAYLTSFLVIGIIWVNHHAVFALVGRVDRVTHPGLLVPEVTKWVALTTLLLTSRNSTVKRISGLLRLYI